MTIGSFKQYGVATLIGPQVALHYHVIVSVVDGYSHCINAIVLIAAAD